MPPPALDSLPLDVAYNILSHLYQGQHSKAHPYLALSAVSRALNGLIESYTAHLIATRRAQFSSSAAPAQKPTNRRRLLHHIWTYCEFCNRKSRRSAILACELVCCKNCDQTQWPRKITMTEACKRYHLKQPDLYSAKIRFGQYYGVTGLTTLFLEPEVRELATRIHAGPGGDLEMYLALRASQSVERKAKQEEARETRKAHLRRVLIANGLPGEALVTRLSPLLFPLHNQRPAISVLEIVRMQLLKQRMETEIRYRQYDLQTDSTHCQRDTPSNLTWDARLWDTRMTEDLAFLQLNGAKSPYGGSIHDACDRALFELFCREFGLYPAYFQDEDSRVADEEDLYLLYRSHRRMWASVSNAKSALEMPKQTLICSSRRARWETTIAHSQPPWSWARYPILVKDVASEDPESVATTTTATEDPKKAAVKENERNRIAKWNAGAEKEMNRITALIKDKGLNMEMWCRFREPGHEVYEVEEVEAAGALQVLREGGREIIVLD